MNQTISSTLIAIGNEGSPADLVQEVGEQLIKRKESIALAESVTGGMLQFLLSTHSSAQQFFQGGITAYNAGQKTRLLAINPIKAFECEAVSAYVAGKMAEQVAVQFCAEWSIGITGFASANSNRPAYCYFAIWHNETELLNEKIIAENKGDRASIQEFYCIQMLTRLKEILIDSDSRPDLQSSY